MATRTYGNEEIENLRRWFDSNEDSASERLVRELESIVAIDYPCERVLATNSAMGALHIALQTVGVGQGGDVIDDPIGVFAGMATMYHNAVPVFADVLATTFNMDPASLESRISERTRAIIVTHHFGNVADMSSIIEIAKARS